MDDKGIERVSPRFASIFLTLGEEVFLGSQYVDRWEELHRGEPRPSHYRGEETWGIYDMDGNCLAADVGNQPGCMVTGPGDSCLERTHWAWMHRGDWSSPHWGVIDSTGNWVVEPRFADYTTDSWQDRVVFAHEESTDDCGVFDVTHGRVLAEHLYNITFLKDGKFLGKKFSNSGRHSPVCLYSREGELLLEFHGAEFDVRRDGKAFSVSEPCDGGWLNRGFGLDLSEIYAFRSPRKAFSFVTGNLLSYRDEADPCCKGIMDTNGRVLLEGVSADSSPGRSRPVLAFSLPKEGKTALLSEEGKIVLELPGVVRQVGEHLFLETDFGTEVLEARAVQR